MSKRKTPAEKRRDAINKLVARYGLTGTLDSGGAINVENKHGGVVARDVKSRSEKLTDRVAEAPYIVAMHLLDSGKATARALNVKPSRARGMGKRMARAGKRGTGAAGDDREDNPANTDKTAPSWIVRVTLKEGATFYVSSFKPVNNTIDVGATGLMMYPSAAFKFASEDVATTVAGALRNSGKFGNVEVIKVIAADWQTVATRKKNPDAATYVLAGTDSDGNVYFYQYYDQHRTIPVATTDPQKAHVEKTKAGADMVNANLKSLWKRNMVGPYPFKVKKVSAKKRNGNPTEEIYTVIPSRVWINIRTGQRASIYGAAPGETVERGGEWELTTVGYTVRNNRDGTTGIGRQPWKTREEAEAWAAQANARMTRKGNPLDLAAVAVNAAVGGAARYLTQRVMTGVFGPEDAGEAAAAKRQRRDEEQGAGEQAGRMENPNSLIFGMTPAQLAAKQGGAHTLDVTRPKKAKSARRTKAPDRWLIQRADGQFFAGWRDGSPAFEESAALAWEHHSADMARERTLTLKDRGFAVKVVKQSTAFKRENNPGRVVRSRATANSGRVILVAVNKAPKGNDRRMGYWTGAAFDTEKKRAKVYPSVNAGMADARRVADYLSGKWELQVKTA